MHAAVNSRSSSKNFDAEQVTSSGEYSSSNSANKSRSSPNCSPVKDNFEQSSESERNGGVDEIRYA